MMKIVVLDGYTLNPGDLDWDGFRALGELTVYDRTPAEQVIERATGAELILTNKTPINEAQMAALPDMKYIGVLATGYNVVEIEAAARRGIVVTNIPTYGTHSVAQMTFALLLELCHRVQHHSDAVRAGDWSRCEDFCFWNYPLMELAGKTFGAVGFGKIGQAAADVAQALGMKVIAYDLYKSDQSQRKDFAWAELDELFAASDVVSLHCPLTAANKGIINRDALAQMKKSAFLINTSRGPLVDEESLAAALNEGRIAGAAVDVLCVEPPKTENPLLSAKNCLVTPHISWATKEARAKLMGIAVDNLKAFLDGEPVNMVKP